VLSLELELKSSVKISREQATIRAVQTYGRYLVKCDN